MYCISDMKIYSDYLKFLWVVMLGKGVVYMIMGKVNAMKVVGEDEDVSGKKFSVLICKENSV